MPLREVTGKWKQFGSKLNATKPILLKAWFIWNCAWISYTTWKNKQAPSKKRYYDHAWNFDTTVEFLSTSILPFNKSAQPSYFHELFHKNLLNNKIEECFPYQIVNFNFTTTNRLCQTSFFIYQQNHKRTFSQNWENWQYFFNLETIHLLYSHQSSFLFFFKQTPPIWTIKTNHHQHHRHKTKNMSSNLNLLF